MAQVSHIDRSSSDEAQTGSDVSNSRKKDASHALILSRIYVPEAGAASYRLAALAAELEHKGFDVRVLTTQSPMQKHNSKGVRRWPVLRDRSGAVRGYLQYASFDVPLFFRLLCTRRVSVVICEPPPTTGVVCRLVCAMRRVPYVYFSADVSSTAAAGIGVNRLVVRVLRSVESWVLNGAAAVLAVSDEVGDQVVALGAAKQKVSVVGTGIDTEVFGPRGPSPSCDYPYVLYAGTMSEIHGAGIFIDAFGLIARENATVRLKMFGQGSEVDALKARADQVAPGRVDFSEPLSGAAIAEWMRGAHAGLASVRPTSGYDFAFATKALATLSCGTPVVYAGVGPVRRLIAEHDLGWATDWDADDVARALGKALSSAPSVSTRQRLSKWVLDNHSLRGVAERAAQAIELVLKR